MASKFKKWKIKEPPANLNISPPHLPIFLISNSMYLLIAKAIFSAPSAPILLSYSVKFVNPEISANITFKMNLNVIMRVPQKKKIAYLGVFSLFLFIYYQVNIRQQAQEQIP